MNLSPNWVDELVRYGLEAVHWSTVGAPAAPDGEILSWARDHGFVLGTNDLDFAAILAATSGQSPSVVQLRVQDILSDAAVNAVATTVEAYRGDIKRGALLSVDESGTRVRMLPLRD